MGSYRLFLCIAVLLEHLSIGFDDFGLLGVVNFYMLSGYLITLVLNESYSFRLKPFALNRFLRLYPTYYVSALIALALLFLFRADFESFQRSWGPAPTLASWLGNIFMVPWAFLGDRAVDVNPLSYSQVMYFRLVPSTWSVATELVCYFLLWLFFARKARYAVVGIGLFGAYHIAAFFLLSGSHRYYPWMAAMLPFSIGALLYFVKARGMFQFEVKGNGRVLGVIAVAIGLFTANYYSTDDLPLDSYNFYTNMLIALMSIIFLSNMRPTGALKSLDKLLGNCSYPLFLLHYPAGLMGYKLLKSMGILSSDAANRGPAVFFAGTLIGMAISILIVIFLDEPIQRIRERIRPRTPASA